MKTDPCQSYQKILVDYADLELSPERAQEVVDHVQSCHSCQQLLAALKQSLFISQGLWRTGYESAKSIAARGHTQKHPRFIRKLIAAAACALLTGVALLMVHR